MMAGNGALRSVLVGFALILGAMPVAISGQQTSTAGTIEGEASGGDRAGHVIWVDDIEGNFPPPKQHAVMDQKNLQFVPHVIAILAGTTVDFANSDPLLHNVFSISPAKRFNLGLYPKGKAPSVVFDRPGVVEILCNVHPEMSAYVVVVKDPYFAVTGSEGRFKIRGVPAGVHTVRCWSEDGRTETRKVVVTAGGIDILAF